MHIANPLTLTEQTRPPSALQFPPAHRLPTLDATRFLAGIAVIWFHSIESDSLRPSGVLGRSSVAFYTMAAILFLVDSAFRKQRPFSTYALDRFKRLAPPFIVWSLINFLVLLFVASRGMHVDLPRLSPDLLVDGGTLHLWYIPFLLLACLAVYPIATWMRTSRKKQFATAAISIAIACALDFHMLDGVTIPNIPVLSHLLDLTGTRWSAIYWGIAAAIAWRNGLSAGTSTRARLAILGACGLLLCTIWQWQFGLNAILKTYGGLSILLLALAPLDNPFVHLLAPLGRLSPAIYFAHMPAIYLARYLLANLGITAADWSRDLTTFLFATALSLTLIQSLALLPHLHWLLALDTNKHPKPGQHPAVPLPAPIARAA